MQCMIRFFVQNFTILYFLWILTNTCFVQSVWHLLGVGMVHILYIKIAMSVRACVQNSTRGREGGARRRSDVRTLKGGKKFFSGSDGAGEKKKYSGGSKKKI